MPSMYYCHVCGAKEEHIHHCKKTNADRIRAMSDEEVAEFLSVSQWGFQLTPNGWLEWLKREVE